MGEKKMKMKIGDLVKRIHWHQIMVPQSMQKYPLEPMNGVIIERLRVCRSAHAGDPWDFMVLWESGNISQLSNNGIEKFRPCHEDRVRSDWEEEGEGSDESR
jgi:hypothetical protein